MLAADRRVRRGDRRVFMVGLRMDEWTNQRMGKSQWWIKYTTDGGEGKGIACGRFLCYTGEQVLSAGCLIAAIGATMQQEDRMAKRKAIPKAVKDRLLVEAIHRCCLCPEHQEVVDLHHIVPISEEGPDTEGNLMRQWVSQEQK